MPTPTARRRVTAAPNQTTASVYAFPPARARAEVQKLAAELARLSPYDAARGLLSAARRQRDELIALGLSDAEVEPLLAAWLGATRDEIARAVRRFNPR